MLWLATSHDTLSKDSHCFLIIRVSLIWVKLTQALDLVHLFSILWASLRRLYWAIEAFCVVFAAACALEHAIAGPGHPGWSAPTVPRSPLRESRRSLRDTKVGISTVKKLICVPKCPIRSMCWLFAFVGRQVKRTTSLIKVRVSWRLWVRVNRIAHDSVIVNIASAGRPCKLNLIL